MNGYNNGGSQQVKRKGVEARKKHAEMVEMGRRRMNGKQRREVLEGMLVDNTDTEMLGSSAHTEQRRKDLLVDNQVGSSSSCGESVGEEEAENRNEVQDEDSSDDSSEDSSSEESSSSDGDEEQGSWPQSHQQYNPGGGHQYPSGFPGPSQFQNPPSQFQGPTFPSHQQFHQNVQYQTQWQQQANLAWYQNWSASVQLQRQQVSRLNSNLELQVQIQNMA